MDARLEQTILPTSSFVDPAGRINIKELCEAFGLDQATVRRATDASRQVVSNYFRASRYIQPRDEDHREFFEKLEQLYTLLLPLIDPRQEKEDIQRWLHSPSRKLKRRRPIDLLEEGKIDLLIRALKDILEGAQGG